MNINNFSIKEYISILTFAKKQKYIICPVKHVKKITENTAPILILRHDVDLDINTALSMARLEQKESVRSTYFILLYNNFYNPLSPENKLKIVKIKNCGHEIGIHWDSRNYNSKEKTRFRRDLKLLSEIVGEKIISGSQHEPVSTPLLKISSSLKFETYRDFKDFTYISDSSMVFRQNPYELLKCRQNIQFLVHPFWWITKGKNRREKFNSFLSSLTRRNCFKINEYNKSTEVFLKNRENNDKYFKL